jgi:ATP-binding cassette subfamily B protein
MESENLNEMKPLRDAIKLFKRSVPGFKEKLTVSQLKENPYIITMIQTALSGGGISIEERFIIRKVTRAYYSFVSGKIIDEVLPRTIEDEKINPTSVYDIAKMTKNLGKNNREITEYDNKIHVLTFAYITAFEDDGYNRKKHFIDKLVEKFGITDRENERVIKEVKDNFLPRGKKRQGNIFREIVKPTEEKGEEYRGSKLRGVVEMFDFVKEDKTLYIGSLVLMAVMCIIANVNPVIIRYIIDNVFKQSDYSIFIRLLIGFSMFAFGLRIIMAVTRFISQKFTVRSAHKASRDIKDKVYNHLMHLPFSYYDKNKTGEIISICTSDINNVTRTFATINAQLVRIVVTFIPAFIIMLYMNWRLALISIATFPITILMSLIFFGMESRAYETYQEQEAKVSAVIQENLTGVRVVKAFARQEFEEEKFELENSEKYAKGKKLMSIHALFWPVTDVIGTVQICTSLIIGSIMTLSGTITLGTIVAFVQYLFMIIWPMKILGRMTVELGKASVSWKRINKILHTASEDIHTGIEPDKKLRGEIEFKDVTFEYENDLPVIKDFNLKIKAGEKVALIGHTGSGKTTIVNLLSGFYPIKKGEVLVDGRSINDYARAYLNDQIGLIHQEGFLFSKTIKENIAFARKDAGDEAIIEAAKRADIHDNIMNFPDGYETKVGEKGVTLSGGQKQRVTIARTILKDPAILILDDSLSAVDTETEARIQSALDEVMDDRTSIIIGHRITSIMKADKIIVLEDGNIAQQGTHDELIKQEGIYKSIFDIQSKIEEEIEKEVTANE